jgi:hypothetical protein
MVNLWALASSSGPGTEDMDSCPFPKLELEVIVLEEGALGAKDTVLSVAVANPTTEAPRAPSFLVMLAVRITEPPYGSWSFSNVPFDPATEFLSASKARNDLGFGGWLS